MSCFVYTWYIWTCYNRYEKSSRYESCKYNGLTANSLKCKSCHSSWRSAVETWGIPKSNAR